LKKTYRHVSDYREWYPLTRRIINDVSILFQNPAIVTIDKETLTEDLKDLLDNSMFNATMDKVNRMVNLTYKVGVMPVYRNGIVELDIITGDKCFVYQDPSDPKRITDLFIHINSLDQTPRSDYDHRQDAYIRWNKDYQSIVYVEYHSGTILKESEPVPNPYGKIPVVWFTNDIGVSNFWPETANGVVDINKWLNINLSNLNVVWAYQSYSTLVLNGVDKKDLQNILTGPQQLIALDYSDMAQSQPDAKYITPDAKVDSYMSYIAQAKIDAAKSVGLSGAAYRAEGSGGVESGYKLKLSNEGLLRKVRKEREYYRPSMKNLIRLMMDVYTINNKSREFPQDIKININFAEIKYDEDPKTVAEVNDKKLEQGITSPIRILMENDPDLTLEEAAELYMKLKEENNLASTTVVNNLESVLLNNVV